MVPNWAPNIHPLIVHFPIVLLIMAAVFGLVAAGLQRSDWPSRATAALYLAATVATVVSYWSGTEAAATVHVPGMGHPYVQDHRVWALATTALACVAAVAALAVSLTPMRRSRMARAGLAMAGLVLVVLIHQTAERGARLVYEFGIGVIPASGTSTSGRRVD